MMREATCARSAPLSIWSDDRDVPLEMTHDWLCALDESDPTPMRYLIDKAGALVPALVSERTRGSLSVYSEYLSSLPGDWTRFQRAPSLLLGARAGYTNRVWVGNLDDEQATRIGDQLTHVSSEEPKPAHIVAALSCDRKGTRRALAMLGENSLVFVARPETVLYPQTFPARNYVESLSASRRRKVRRERQRLADLGYELIECSLADHIDTFARLTANMVVKHGGSSTKSSLERHFQTLSKYINDRAVGFLLMLRNKPVASALMFRQADTFVAKNVGIETSAIRRQAEIFAAAYYSTAEFAAAAGAERLYGGIASYEPKLMRGYQLEPRWSVVQLPATAKERSVLWDAVGKSNGLRAHHYATLSGQHETGGPTGTRTKEVRDFVYHDSGGDLDE